MIGLMFFGAIGLWIFIAVVLGLKLPKWLAKNTAQLITLFALPNIWMARSRLMHRMP